MADSPIIVEDVDLLQLIKHLLRNHLAPSTLVVCSSKNSFLKFLSTEVEKNSIAQHEKAQTELSLANEDTTPDSALLPVRTLHDQWGVPTLRLLSSSRTLKLAFCPDVTHLRAYLAIYATRKVPPDGKATGQEQQSRILAILNPIDLHRPTSAFSAQGMNRSLSMAVEAAHESDSLLMIAEIPQEQILLMTHDYSIPQANETQDLNKISTSPWDQEVSILNVTTKSFGAGERGWVGRTVKLRQVAQRWCVFQSLPAK